MKLLNTSLIRWVINSISLLSKAWRALFDNNLYYESTAWTPSSPNFKVEGYFRYDSASVGAESCILGDADSNSERIQKTATDRLQIAYMDITDTQRFLTFDPDAFSEFDRDYWFSVDQADETGFTLELRKDGPDGELVNTRTNTNAIKYSDFNLKYFGAVSNGTKTMQGRIWGISLEDRGPFNKGGDYLEANGIDIYGSISPIPVTSGAEVEVDWEVATDGSNNQFFGNTVNPYPAYVDTDGTFKWNSGSVGSMTVNGDSVTWGNYFPRPQAINWL